MRTLGILLMLALCANAEIVCDISHPSPGSVNLSWSDSSSTGGYAVAMTTNLASNSWAYAGDVDAWPTSETNWSVTGNEPTAFYRVEQTARGEILSAANVTNYTTVEIAYYLWTQGITNIAVTYNVAIYKITYETFDARGESTVASGGLCVPVGRTSAPVVSYQHGTIFKRDEAPSAPDADDVDIGVIFATEGYAAVMPDYLGLGMDSPPLHPYVHARSEAVACVDMLRASYAQLATLSLTPNGQLFLVGYSQGGHATLALQRELETHHAVEFPLTASAPMAGPHDLSGTMKDLILSDTPYGSPAYVAYILFGQNSVYNFFDSASEILTTPYSTTLPPLMDGEHSGGEIENAMTNIPKRIFTTAFLDDFTNNSNNVFRAALRANDTYRWVPAVTTRVYHCAGDMTVPKANSIIAVSEMQARGSTHVTLVDPAPAADHNSGAEPCFFAAKDWFDSLLAP